MKAHAPDTPAKARGRSPQAAGRRSAVVDLPWWICRDGSAVADAPEGIREYEKAANSEGILISDIIL
ncbi:MAG: hypothetical protein CL946_10455 [Ectothiorhodospiraceae bacterium]|nr:hypothetical protein [Ectothiorhodospiraceae bacterium]